MDEVRTPEQFAAEMVRVVSEQGPAHVELRVPGAPPVRLQSHQNPDLAGVEADQIRQFLAAAVRAARVNPG